MKQVNSDNNVPEFLLGVKIVRELYGVMAAAQANSGILATFGIFTQEAKNFAKGKPIDLIAGNQLVKLISEVQKAA